jgi:hypothetical protein
MLRSPIPIRVNRSRINRIFFSFVSIDEKILCRPGP